MTDAWRILANPTRQKLVELLQERSRTTGELCTYFNLSRFAVMQHLKVLEQAGVITAEKRGRHRLNHLNRDRLRSLRAAMASDTTPPAAIEETFLLPAAPELCFTALTSHIGRWWRHPLPDESGAAVLIALETRLGGRFWRHVADDAGQGTLFATVDRLTPGKLLGLYGPMGLDTAVSLIRLRFIAEDGQTRLHLSHRFMGDVAETAVAAFRQSWLELIDLKLRNFLAAD